MFEAPGLAGGPGSGDGAGAEPVRVFISYAHDDREHEDRVREFWLFLRANRIDARLDKPAAERRQDWPLWMLREARFVLVVASPAYRRRAEGDEPPDRGSPDHPLHVEGQPVAVAALASHGNLS